VVLLDVIRQVCPPGWSSLVDQIEANPMDSWVKSAIDNFKKSNRCN